MGDDAFIPYGRQWVTADDARAVAEAATDDYLTTGPKVKAFEKAVAKAAGVSHAVAVNSGTAALHAAYFALGLGKGDEIITTPLTFAATSNAALYLGASVRFADVLSDTGNIDPERVAEAITDRTKLIVAVDYAGHPADYASLRAIADANGLGLVGDAAHSIGATRDGAPTAALPDASTFSFHPVKSLTTGEGGAVVTKDAAVSERASEFRNHGLVRDRKKMANDEGPWFYEMQSLGLNYRLTDLQCALGLSQFERFDAFLARRREIAAAYDRRLAHIESIELPTCRDAVESGWHLYVLRTRDPDRRRPFFERLRELGLGVQVHYIPVYWHPYYQGLGFERGLCPVAEDFYRRAVSVPMYPRMTNAELDSVVSRIERAAQDVF